MPRQIRLTEPADVGATSRTVVIDNGSHTIKTGFADPLPDAASDCKVIPNCIARSSEGGRGGQKIYIADQLEQCEDLGEVAFRRPLEKGFIVNWDLELDIWKQTFFKNGAKLQCDPHETNLLLTEASNCPLALQTNTDQIIFEELEFASAYRCSGPSLNVWNDVPALMGDQASDRPRAECAVIIDSGYSDTTVTPVIHGRPVEPAIRRLEVGGKTMTNLLKELSSLRHWNLMDESHLVSQIKEDTCYVSQDFKRDLQNVWDMKGPKQKANALQQGTLLEYILPDYRTTYRGHVKTDFSAAQPSGDETTLPLGNERFVVPELLFNPSDIGSSQTGLPEMVVQSLSCLPVALWPGVLANIVVVGGNAKLPGFVERLETELRGMTPGDCLLRVRAPKDPLTYTWLGGARLASNQERMRKTAVSRQDYLEHGAHWTQRRFAAGIK